MFRALYTSGWGMLATGKSMDVISNNLANVNTTGFKKDGFVMEAFPDLLAKRINDTQTPSSPTGAVGKFQATVDLSEIYTDLSQGQMQKTDRSLDMAIFDAKNAFFTVGVKDTEGNLQEYYSKNGAFEIDGNGFLTTLEGNSVMGEKGPIKLSSENFKVSDDGTITEDGKAIDKLKLKQFEDPKNLRKYGFNLFTAQADEAGQPFTGQIKQGSIETSNVNSIREMIDMINVMRTYEANQKVISAIDGTIEKAVNEVGNVR